MNVSASKIDSLHIHRTGVTLLWYMGNYILSSELMQKQIKHRKRKRIRLNFVWNYAELHSDQKLIPGFGSRMHRILQVVLVNYARQYQSIGLVWPWPRFNRFRFKSPAFFHDRQVTSSMHSCRYSLLP